MTIVKGIIQSDLEGVIGNGVPSPGYFTYLSNGDDGYCLAQGTSDSFTCVDSSPWKKHKIRTLAINNDTLINTSIMRWTDNRKVFNKFLKHRDLYLRLYKGIDRFIFNENVSYKTFKGEAISSWQEGIENNTIVLYNGKYV